MLSACDDSFHPTAPFQPRLVVYSVLSTETDTQYVRVYATYPDKPSDSLRVSEPVVSDAQVTIRQGATTFTFRDTLLKRATNDMYTGNIQAFIAFPFRPAPNQTYTLDVVSPTLGRVSATTGVPGRAQLSLVNSLVLEQPILNAPTPVYVTAFLGPNAEGFLVRLYLVFVAEIAGEGLREHYYEVPQAVRLVNRLNDEYENIYPSVNRRSPTTPRPTVFFTNTAYRRSIEEIRRFHFSVRFRRAVFYLVQFDEAWYKYYGTARIYQDRYSIRLDEPDYTNIVGGAGLFGSFRVDSLVYQLPEFIER